MVGLEETKKKIHGYVSFGCFSRHKVFEQYNSQILFSMHVMYFPSICVSLLQSCCNPKEVPYLLNLAVSLYLGYQMELIGQNKSHFTLSAALTQI